MGPTTTPDFGFCRELDEQLFSILRRISADDGQARWIINRLIQTVMADYTDGSLAGLLTACDEIPSLYAVCYLTDRPFLCTKRYLYFKVLIKSTDKKSFQISNIFKVQKKYVADLQKRRFSIEKTATTEKHPPLLSSPE